MKASELRNMSVEELQDAVASAESSLRNLRFAHAVSPIENPMRIRAARKDIARLKTELQARTYAVLNEKVASGELTEDNAREFLKQENANLPSSVQLKVIKKVIGNSK
ncbi:MAG: 50S ribosomal protein L29 [Flammeovirgaceae bacterium]